MESIRHLNIGTVIANLVPDIWYYSNINDAKIILGYNNVV